MIFKLTTISVILFLTTLLNFFTTYAGWQRRKIKGGDYFTLGMAGLSFWTLAAGFDYAAVPIPLKVLFAKLEYLGYNAALALLTIFVLSYAGHDDWLKKKWVKIFFILLPLSNILLAWTNDIHGWIWSGFTRNVYGDNIVIFHHGPGFLWEAFTGYLMVAIIVVNLWQVSRKGSGVAGLQARLLFFASIFPIASNIIYLLDIPAINGIDWTSVAFSISGFLFLAALYGTRLLDIVPIARDAAVEGMSDCFLVLDMNNHMVEFNLAAQENFRINKDQLGMPIEIAMADWTDIVDFATTHSQDTAQSIIAQAGTARVFDVHLTSLKDQRGRTFGKVIVFRDATERHQTEQVLEQRLKEIQELHENLKTSQAELVEQQRMLAKMEERQRMGRDLHDSVSQSIHSLVLFTETLAATLDKNNIKRARQIAGRVQESARQAHKETRLLLYGLQDTGTDRIVNLIEALEDRLTNVERHTGVKVNFIQEGVQQDLPQEWLENLFWIATEALNNALKYAQAHIIQIVMDWQETGFEMEIRDDGIGFDSTMMQTGGLGMHTMRERANLLGGELHIISSPGNGTRVCFRSKKEK